MGDEKNFKRIKIDEFARLVEAEVGRTLVRHDEFKAVSVKAKVLIPSDVWEMKVDRGLWELSTVKLDATRATVAEELKLRENEKQRNAALKAGEKEAKAKAKAEAKALAKVEADNVRAAAKALREKMKAEKAAAADPRTDEASNDAFAGRDAEGMANEAMAALAAM